LNSSPPTPTPTDPPPADAAEEARALAEFQPLVYADLHQLAVKLMSKERPDHTLQPTALVHEVFVRLWDESACAYQDRGHFFATAARAMRRILVDFARRRAARIVAAPEIGGADGRRAQEDAEEDTAAALRWLAVEEALIRLQTMDPTLTQVVELRFFAGLSHAEIAAVTRSSVRSVERHWALARAWLERELGGDPAP
jgi:RNA polymerase sigma factor (TIGR02999 family)